MKETETWVGVARCSDIPLREGRAVTVGNREIAIFNLGDRFLAIDNRCPHKGGPLADGIISGTTVVCPLHAWKFSLETGDSANSASSTSCVRTFPTTTQDGVIFLQLSEDPRDSQESSHTVPLACVETHPVSGIADVPLTG